MTMTLPVKVRSRGYGFCSMIFELRVATSVRIVSERRSITLHDIGGADGIKIQERLNRRPKPKIPGNQKVICIAGSIAGKADLCERTLYIVAGFSRSDHKELAVLPGFDLVCNLSRSLLDYVSKRLSQIHRTALKPFFECGAT